MPPAAPKRALVWGGVTLGLAGTWLGHTGEYVRVWGTRGLTTELVGSVHIYMAPLGIVIGVAGLVMAAQLWGLWVRLGNRLDAARRSLRAALRGKPVRSRRATNGGIPSLSSRVLIAWPALTLLQIALYLAQENIEAAIAGTPVPGIGAITGVHAFAPVVHALVALTLLLALGVALRILRARIRIVEAVESIVRLLAGARTGGRVSAQPASRIAPAPLQLFGCNLLQRPPPQLGTL